MDWSTLVERIKRGEDAAGAELVSVLAAQLDRYALTLDESRRLSTREREEAVEAAVVKVVRRIRDYNPSRATLPTWARGFVRNELREAIRSRKEIIAGTELETLLAQSRERDERAARPESGENATPAQIALLTLLLQLKPGDAELIYLRAVELLPFQSIADRLETDITAAALRKRYQRSRDALIEAAKADPHLKHLTEADTQQ